MPAHALCGKGRALMCAWRLHKRRKAFPLYFNQYKMKRICDQLWIKLSKVSVPTCKVDTPQHYHCYYAQIYLLGIKAWFSRTRSELSVPGLAGMDAPAHIWYFQEMLVLLVPTSQVPVPPCSDCVNFESKEENRIIPRYFPPHHSWRRMSPCQTSPKLWRLWKHSPWFGTHQMPQATSPYLPK